MKFDYRLSIIVPCHNSSKTIERLLTSIIINDLDKDECEIIIVDDNSTDNFIDKVKKYENMLNIVYQKTNTNVHCPGNTRQAGLDIARGEWITFIDHDDYFEPNIFKKVFATIEENAINSILCTSFYFIHMDGTKEEYKNYDNYYYHHGKFYSHKMILDCNLKMEKDLVSYEDVYFNNMIESILLLPNEYNYMNYNPDLFTYNWVETPTSLTHYKDEKSLLYMDLHFKDYMYAVFAPVFILPEEFHKYKCNRVIPDFIKFYCIYEQGLYRHGDNFKNLNFPYMCKLKDKICENLNINSQDIINYCYEDPILYNDIKESSFNNLNTPFIEDQSLRDFIIDLNSI